MDTHYHAFISYRHHPEDIKVAEQIHKGLEHYNIPKAIRKRTDGKLRLFRDKEELPITSNLTDDITRALRGSDFLIVICSTHTGESQWVQREIEVFLQTHDHNRVLTVLVDGENPYDIIPPILCSKTQTDPQTGEVTQVPIEPLSCDWRVGRRKARREELPRLAAALLGCGYDELRQRERQYRTRRLIAVFSAALVAVLALTGYVVYNSMQIQKANEQLENANNRLTDANIRIQNNLEEAQYNQSQYLASASQQQLEAGDRMLAMALALEALPEHAGERPYVAQAELSLSSAVGAYQAESEVAAVGSVTSDGLVTYFEATDDRKWMYVFDARFVLSVWDMGTYQKHAALQLDDAVAKMLVTPQDHVLVCTFSDQLYCYDKDLTLLWQAEGCQDVFDSTGRDVVLAAAENNTIRFLDSKTGRQVRDEIQVCLRPEDLEEGWEIGFYQKSYDLEMPIVLEYYDYGQPRKVISLDLVSGETYELAMLPENMIVRYTGFTQDGNALILTADENGVWNADFGQMMTHSPVVVRLVCVAPTGGQLWTTELISYSYSEVHTLYPIPGTGNLFCQIDNLLAVLDSTTGEVLGTCETGARPVWVSPQETSMVAILEDGSMGSYFYSNNEFNSTRYLKEDIVKGFAGKGVYIQQKFSQQILKYTDVADKNWQIFQGEYVPTLNHWRTQGNLIAIDNYDGICLFDAREQKHLWTLDENGDTFQLLDFSEDGEILWIVRSGKEIAAVDTETGEWELFPLPEEADNGNSLIYRSGYHGRMADGIIYTWAVDWQTEDAYLVTFDTQTRKTACRMLGFTVSDWIFSNTGILAADDGVVYMWDADSANVQRIAVASGKTEIFLEKAAAKPVIQLLNDKSTWMVCADNQITLYGPGEQKLFSTELDECNGVSGFLMDGQLLLLTDTGVITRLDLSGKILGEIPCHIYTTFVNEVGNYAPEELGWAVTKDGDLFVNLYNAGNLIDSGTWQRRAWIPNCVGYLPELDQIVTVGQEETDQNKIGVFPLYSMEDIKAMAKEALGGYALTPEQKAQYGIS